MSDKAKTKLTVRYKITCPDEFPDVIEQDCATWFTSANSHEIAKLLAEVYMKDNIYDWDDDTEPGDLFHITAFLGQDSTFVVQFFSNFSNSHLPEHTILVDLVLSE